MDICPCGSLVLTSRISSDSGCHREMCWRLQPLQMLGLHLYHIITSQHSSAAFLQACVRPPHCRTALRSILAEKNAERQPCVWFNERLFLLSVGLSSFESSPSLPHSAPVSHIGAAACRHSAVISAHFHIDCLRFPPIRLFDREFIRLKSLISISHPLFIHPALSPHTHTHIQLQCF